MLEIVFLGTGSAVPSKTRSLAAIWMHYASERAEPFLFDCGEGTQLQMMKARLSFMKLERIFISHWHADHWAGLIGLIQTMNLEGRKEPLRVYGPEADRFVENILELGYWAPRFRVLPVDVPFEGEEVTTLYQTEDFEILSIPARHSVPAVMYCFKERDKINVDIEKAQKLYGLTQGRLVGQLKEKGSVTVKGKTVRLDEVAVVKKGVKAVYTGDTRACPNLQTIAHGADVVIHDSTFESEDETKMHAGAEEAARAAKEAGVQHLILTHFSRRYQDVTDLEKKARAIFPDSIAARDFMTVRVKPGLFKVGP
ncbi:MAG: ribonuclease Z [Candidatus Aenigmarchaeota archaeon]|nr:ribonuclease Z [Candidatus Aenigmarchaeota archaeon]